MAYGGSSRPSDEPAAFSGSGRLYPDVAGALESASRSYSFSAAGLTHSTKIAFRFSEFVHKDFGGEISLAGPASATFGTESRRVHADAAIARESGGTICK